MSESAAKYAGIGLAIIGEGIPFSLAVYRSSAWWLILFFITVIVTIMLIKD